MMKNTDKIKITELKQDAKMRSFGKRRRRIQIHTGQGLTEQSHKDQCDMNYILEDYTKTGLIKHAKQYQGKYDDVAVQDFQTALDIVKQSQEMFNQLPSLIRKRFNGNPADFLSFTQDPKNKKEMQDLGILKGNDGIDISGAPSKAPVSDVTINKPTPTGDDKKAVTT